MVAPFEGAGMTTRKQPRRQHGSGSVYQYPAGSGRWFAALPTVDEAGRRRTTRRMAPTEAAAKRLLTKMRDDRDQGLDTGGGKQTLSRFLATWLEVSAKPRVRPSTWRRYEGIVRVHLAPPPLGAIRLEALRPEHVDRLLEARRQSGSAPKTLQQVRAVLRRALNYARRQRYVSDNAASLSEPPKLIYSEVEPLTPDQARQLLAAVRDDRLEALITVALALGLRQGEALGLRWVDADLEGRLLHVRQSLAREGGAFVVAPLKTNRSRRTIALPAPVVEGLRAHAARQAVERAHAEPVGAWDSTWDGLVFRAEDGSPLKGQKVTRRFQAILRAEDLPHQRFHDLRHACASLLLAQGVALPEIQDVLGHASFAFTREIYAHLSAEMRRNAADRMGDFLSG